MSLKLLLSLIILISFGILPIYADDDMPVGSPSLIGFPHVQHQKSLGGCTDCHGTGNPGPIADFSERWAHTTCTGCHRDSQSGPTECGGCHTQL